MEDHEEGGILDQASRLLNNSMPEVKLSKNQRYKANVKARKQATAANAEDFSAIIVTMLTLILSAWPAPDDIKPNDEEINAFSVPVTRLLLRHVPIISKFSADALDALGMIGALSAYYVRTNPARKKYAIEQQAKRESEIAATTPTLYDTYPQPVTPIENLPVEVMQ